MRGFTRRTSSPTVALFAKTCRLFAHDPTLHPVAPCGHTVAHDPSAKVADRCQANRYFRKNPVLEKARGNSRQPRDSFFRWSQRTRRRP